MFKEPRNKPFNPYKDYAYSLDVNKKLTEWELDITSGDIKLKSVTGTEMSIGKVYGNVRRCSLTFIKNIEPVILLEMEDKITLNKIILSDLFPTIIPMDIVGVDDWTDVTLVNLPNMLGDGIKGGTFIIGCKNGKLVHARITTDGIQPLISDNIIDDIEIPNGYNIGRVGLTEDNRLSVEFLK